jgi:hypothetical protein
VRAVTGDFGNDIIRFGVPEFGADLDIELHGFAGGQLLGDRLPVLVADDYRGLGSRRVMTCTDDGGMIGGADYYQAGGTVLKGANQLFGAAMSAIAHKREPAAQLVAERFEVLLIAVSGIDHLRGDAARWSRHGTA